MIANLVLSGVPFFVGILALVVLSWGFWFIMQRRQKVIWLPILKVFPKPKNTILRRYTFTTPPWWLFLCFVLLSLLVLILALQPKERIEIANQQNVTKLHVLVDYSPSISVHVSVDDYKQKILELVDLAESAGFNVYISTSHSDEIFETTDPNFKDWIESKSFHSKPLFWGAWLSKIQNLTQDNRAFVIVGDQEKSTWADFNWQGLRKTQPLYFINVQEELTRDNYYLQQAQIDSTTSPDYRQLSVLVQRNLSKDVGNGTVYVYRGKSEQNKILAKASWSMQKNQEQTEVRLSWLANKDTDWTIQLNIDSGQDRLVMDNQMLLNANESYASAMIYTEIKSESPFLDAGYYLANFMRTIGIQVYRSNILDKLHNQKSSHLILLTGQSDEQNQCSTLSQVKNKKIWLAPYDHASRIANICSCFNNIASLALDCSALEDEGDWARMLEDIGAKQVGGNLSRADQAIAYRLTSKDNDVLVFMWPLVPSLSVGFSYSQFPVAIHKVLQWHLAYQPFNNDKLIKDAYVYAEESRLFYEEESNLLPGLDFKSTDFQNRILQQDKEQDEVAERLVKRLIYLALFLAMMELALTIIDWRKRGSDAF